MVPSRGFILPHGGNETSRGDAKKKKKKKKRKKFLGGRDDGRGADDWKLDSASRKTARRVGLGPNGDEKGLTIRATSFSSPHAISIELPYD